MDNKVGGKQFVPPECNNPRKLACKILPNYYFLLDSFSYSVQQKYRNLILGGSLTT